jgi:hypothetical protein
MLLEVIEREQRALEELRDERITDALQLGAEIMPALAALSRDEPDGGDPK